VKYSLEVFQQVSLLIVTCLINYTNLYLALTEEITDRQTNKNQNTTIVQY